MSGSRRCIPNDIAKFIVLIPHVSHGLAFLHGQKSASWSLAPNVFDALRPDLVHVELEVRTLNLYPRG
jgi:hypothetical protein